MLNWNKPATLLFADKNLNQYGKKAYEKMPWQFVAMQLWKPVIQFLSVICCMNVIIPVTGISFLNIVKHTKMLVAPLGVLFGLNYFSIFIWNFHQTSIYILGGHTHLLWESSSVL